MIGAPPDGDSDRPGLCRDQTPTTRARSEAKGSPPGVRGPGRAAAGGVLIARITPRMCRDQAVAGPRSKFSSGSPPHVRGPAARAKTGLQVQRIIPACAGTSRRPASVPSAYRDHPRVCGDQPAPRPQGPLAGGSPPRVRGPDVDSVRSVLGPRITPACAGTSTSPTPTP